MNPQPQRGVSLVGLSPLVAAGIEALLPELEAPMRCSGIDELQPGLGVVLMDVRGKSDGYESGNAVVATASGAGHHAVVLTAERDELVLLAYVSAGARAVVSHWEDARTMRTAIEVAAVGGQFVSQAFPSLRVAVAGGRRLTPRQRQVVLARADGATLREIALRRNLSVHLTQDFYLAAQRHLAPPVESTDPRIPMRGSR